MIIDKNKLKDHAKELMKNTQKPSVFSVALVFVLLSTVASFLTSKLLGMNLTESLMQHYVDSVNAGNFENAFFYLSKMQPPQGANLISVLISLALSVVGFGFTIYLMNIYHAAQPCMGNLLDGFGMLGRFILLSLLKSIFIFLWSLLFIVPGLIAAYKYRMAEYIMLENPDKSVMQCIKESKALMKGHKWECFGLDLSFIVWYIAALIPYAGSVLSIFSYPYIGLTFINYYHALLMLKEQPEPQTDGTI